MREKFYSEIKKIRDEEPPEEIRLSVEYNCDLEGIASQILETDNKKTTSDIQGVPLRDGIRVLFSSGGSKSTKKAVGSWKDELRTSMKNIGCKHRRLEPYLCHSRNLITRVSKEWRKDPQSHVIRIGCNYLNSEGTHMHLCLYKME
ncbi:hypothetical protein OESDEN_18418 [Oesophagostomum dentatum]|uniref:Uncharacterized protein n=1 Tax=Oesophagostomum dentatum TaxID=61180 RepID=A0A0B1S9B8_OESDE|nr:hypothetical protein OESDEN_18418 [Oesophagostomum dentatum]